MKIYARQVPPEYQDSYFDIENYGDIMLAGSRDYKQYWPQWAENLGDTLTEAYDALCYIQEGRGYYDSWSDALEDLLPPHGRGEYTRQERKQWAKIVEEFNEPSIRAENNALIKALALMTGKAWTWRTLRGSCQGDWIDCFYIEEEWTRAALDVLEAEYFNTGTEWHITEDENDLGYYQYCTGWNDEMIRREIAETSGATPENVVLLKFTGWVSSASYAEVIA
jgi:hypothetical protein